MSTPQIDDGGPAFPIVTGLDGTIENAGMSLRDYFAGQALSGWLASFGPDITPEKPYRILSRFCYEVADAMIIARKKQTPA